MTFDWTITVEGVMLTLIVSGGIPLGTLLVNTLLNINRTLSQHAQTLYGTAMDHDSGIVNRLSAHERELRKQRNWLIEVSAAAGVRQQDRT